MDTYDVGIPTRPPLIGATFRVHPKGVPSRIAVVVKNNVGSYQDDVITVWSVIGRINRVSKPLLGVNFFGAVHVTQAVLPYLREQRSGHIVNIRCKIKVGSRPHQA